MVKFLLDANLSPRTARYLVQTLGLDVVSLLTQHLGTLHDSEVVRLAKREGRVIVTFDGDFAERYWHAVPDPPGVIYLRLAKESQFVPEVNQILERFLRNHAATIDLEHALVTISEQVVQIVRR